MCFFTPAASEPTFGETARDYHHAHIAEVRERSARLAAEERAERLAQRLGQDQADLIAAPRAPSPQPSPPESPKGPTLQVSPSAAWRALNLPSLRRRASRKPAPPA